MKEDAKQGAESSGYLAPAPTLTGFGSLDGELHFPSTVSHFDFISTFFSSILPSHKIPLTQKEYIQCPHKAERSMIK